MKISNVICSVVSTLFVASILTFGLSTEIASAHGGVCEKDHKKEPECNGGGSGGDELMSTFDVVVYIEGDPVMCGNTNCTSKPIRDDRLDRTNALVVKGMDMGVPLRLFLFEHFNNGCFNPAMDGGLSVFEPAASPGTIQVGYDFQGLDFSGNSQGYGFVMFCTIPDADWVGTITGTCQEWILVSHGSLDYCEQATGEFFSGDPFTGIMVSGPNAVVVD